MMSKVEFLKSLKPGAVLYCSWGYDQTNIDFYKVLDVKGSKVTLQEIGSKQTKSMGWASETCVADPERTIGAPFSKIVRSPWIRMTSYSNLFLWNGEPMYRSWYA